MRFGIRAARRAVFGVVRAGRPAKRAVSLALVSALSLFAVQSAPDETDDDRKEPDRTIVFRHFV